ncbi:hypothetical protein K9857_27295 [Pseudomonas sp. REP124]|uniref:hypothetical protein n=1 Tax=Pseudomonas sp. REP124 TaxID=2875731 RepID=UPI001CCF7F82|nr:hypothetical protein [Pseudomonas sp. REP124]MBZ9785259.1 hypothetical protein [Pseudomonas sp. REP124]
MANSNCDIYLVNGNITVFCGTHTETLKQDILNSSLLGELAAISKHSESQDSLWAGFIETVSKIGWITKSREFKRHDFSGKSLLKIIESSVGSSLTREEKDALSKAFSILKKPGTHSPATQRVVDKLQANTFACDETLGCATARATIAGTTRVTIVRSNASIITLQIAFKTTQGINIDILDHPVLDAIKDGKPNIWMLVSSLDARQYNALRATVIKKLGNHIHDDLVHVITPNPVV